MIERIVLGIVILALIATVIWIRWDKKRVENLINGPLPEDEDDDVPR